MFFRLCRIFLVCWKENFSVTAQQHVYCRVVWDTSNDEINIKASPITRVDEVVWQHPNSSGPTSVFSKRQSTEVWKVVHLGQNMENYWKYSNKMLQRELQGSLITEHYKMVDGLTNKLQCQGLLVPWDNKLQKWYPLRSWNMCNIVVVSVPILIEFSIYIS